jgi:2-polyprenyl-6-methoxyphenol hydroxylase-like FAD-dependent oxidoreductase
VDVLKRDVIVIGAGPTGLMAALEAARTGKRVAVLEKRPHFNHRDDSKSRFQALIVDEQTLVNLSNVGLNILKSDFFAINHALLFTDDHQPPQSIPYHQMPDRFEGPSSDDLGPLAFRRRIVAMTSIAIVEQRLFEQVQSNPAIECYFDQHIEHIETVKEIIVTTTTNTIRAQTLAIADGANSDRHGALRHLQISKNRLPHAVDIALVKFQDPDRTGQLVVKEIAGEHAALFGMANETVLYTNLPKNAGQHNIKQHLIDIAASLDLNAAMTSAPLLIRQEPGWVTSAVPSNRTLVLGDAAQSGTAVLGVYFNKGISDAVAFGRYLIDADTTRFAARAQGLPAKTLLMEEHLIGYAWHESFAILRQFNLGNEMAQSIPRSLFRLKAGRHGLVRTLAANTADTIASVASGLSRSLPNNGLSRASKQSAKVWRALQQSLDKTSS